MASRVGMDLVSTDSVCSALAAHGDRYLHRAFTEAEIADCSPLGVPDPQRLGGRLAAKEAGKKGLPRSGGNWCSIEVVRRPGGWTTVALTGPAAAAAREEGVGEISL